MPGAKRAVEIRARQLREHEQFRRELFARLARRKAEAEFIGPLDERNDD